MLQIYKSPTADSRSADHTPTIEELDASTRSHISDVQQAMNFIAAEIMKRAPFHDHTKLEHMRDFYAALTSGHIKDTDWYKKHTTEERHHLSTHVPDQVDIIDLIECICDCCMAGLARSGEIYDVKFPSEMLQLIVDNTVEMFKRNTKVLDKGNPVVDSDDLLDEKISD